jgi:L-lactate dehydrogenase
MQETQGTGRIAIIGAGSVGATIAYALMLRGLAGQIVIIDVNRAKAEGEVKDLNHGLRFVPSVRVSVGEIRDCAGAEIVVITAGAKQKPGQSRLDLAATNVGIFREMIPAITSVAPKALLLVVSNPVDVLTYAAAKMHPDGAHRVLGSGTVLDSSRFVTLIAERIGVSVQNVHAQIIGEHGESELPLWSSAHVGNVSLSEFRAAGHHGLTPEDRSQIISRVRSAAAEIIAAKGATNWAIGLATGRIIEAIRRDENAVLTVSRTLDDYRRISGVCLSVPCIVNRRGAEQALVVPMDDGEISALQASADVVKHACRQAGLH